MPTFTMVGAAFRPAEAKDIIKQLHAGDIIDLVADPENEFDDTAVKVERDGVHIGFIPKTDNAAPFAVLMDGGELTGEIVAFESTLKPIIEYDLDGNFDEDASDAAIGLAYDEDRNNS